MSRDSNVLSRSTLCGALLTGLLLSLSALAGEQDPADLLTRMSQANHKLNYEGTFIYIHGADIQSVRIVHGVDATGEHERLVTLSGKSREVLRDNDEVRCINPDEQSVSVQHPPAGRSISLVATPDVEKISGNYHLLLRGSERIAGRMAEEVAVVPRDRYRYGHAYWIDQTTGLLLRADLISEKGRVVEQMMFTSLALLDSFPSKSLEPEMAQNGQLKPQPARSASSDAGPDEGRWMASELPPGFFLELLRFHSMPGKRVPVEHHVYSDGLASVSVFIEPEESKQPQFLGHTLRGAIHAFARVSKGTRITVIGEVPAVTVEHIADTMRPRQEVTP